MKKRWIILIITIFIIVGLCCFFMIPRVVYEYDEINETYYVDKVYGNSKKYYIKAQINGVIVDRIGTRAFYKKDNLEYLEFENIENIIYIDRLAFSGCSNLKEINLKYVKEIGRNAFEECNSLTEVELNVEHILGSVFYDCTSLSSVKLNNTISIGSYAFANTKISYLVLPESTKEVYINAFSYMESLKEIKIYSKQLLENEYINGLEICVFE